MLRPGWGGAQQRAPKATLWAPKLEVAQGSVVELEVVAVAGLEVSLGWGRRVERMDRVEMEAYLIQGRWKGTVGWRWVAWKVGEWRP